jgi:hypothetical protein
MSSEIVAEIKRLFGVVTEDLRSEIRAVAEGQVALRDELKRDLLEFRQEVRTEFDEVKAMIRFSYAELDRRVRSLESDVNDLRSRLERLETRVGA